VVGNGTESLRIVGRNSAVTVTGRFNRSRPDVGQGLMDELIFGTQGSNNNSEVEKVVGEWL
jgi:hypothetical protein